jgi:hypothetical protein
MRKKHLADLTEAGREQLKQLMAAAAFCSKPTKDLTGRLGG